MARARQPEMSDLINADKKTQSPNSHSCGLRAFMSSIMRWRNGLPRAVLMGNSCPERGCDTSMLRTEFPSSLRDSPLMPR